MIAFRRTRRSLAALALICLAALLATACSSDNKVGSEELLTFEQRQQDELGTTTTTSMAPEPAAEATDTTQPPAQAVATTAPPTTQAQVQQPTLEIRIAGDNERSQFQPPAARVFTGSVIRWANSDSVPRSVVADDGTFDSGPIPPGGHWDYVANTPGRFNYSDGTRPYAVAILEVVQG